MANKAHDADVAFIKALAELLNENDLTELQVKRDYGESDSLNVRVSRATLSHPELQHLPLPPHLRRQPRPRQRPQRLQTRPKIQQAIPALSPPPWWAPFTCNPSPEPPRLSA